MWPYWPINHKNVFCPLCYSPLIPRIVAYQPQYIFQQGIAKYLHLWTAPAFILLESSATRFWTMLQEGGLLTDLLFEVHHVCMEDLVCHGKEESVNISNFQP